jgi:hypothetical protein
MPLAATKERKKIWNTNAFKFFFFVSHLFTLGNTPFIRSNVGQKLLLIREVLVVGYQVLIMLGE